MVAFKETWKKFTYCHLILKWTCIVYTLCTFISFKSTWIFSAMGGASTKLGQRTTLRQVNYSLQDCTILVFTRRKQDLSALNLFRYYFFSKFIVVISKIESVMCRRKIIIYAYYIRPITQPGTF